MSYFVCLIFSKLMKFFVYSILYQGWGVTECDPILVWYVMVHLFTVGKKDTYDSVTYIYYNNSCDLNIAVTQNQRIKALIKNNK